MARWTIVGEPYRYAGGADPSADVDFGFKFTLRPDVGSDQKINVEAARGVSMSAADARRAVGEWLDEDAPPERLVRASDGDFSPQKN
jgi:hypothetical protein